MLHKKNFGDLLYLEYFPDEKKEKTALLVFLHGAGERGDDLEKIIAHGPIKEMISGNIRNDFIIIAPQCEEGKMWWDYAERLYAWVSSYVQNPWVDKSRVYLTGLSMGGYGTWALAMAHPELFAAVLPICGGGIAWNARTLYNTPVWAFHCVGDDCVACRETIDMVEGVKKFSKKDVRITIYPECSHDAWTKTYRNQEVYDWLLQYKLEETI